MLINALKTAQTETPQESKRITFNKYKKIQTKTKQNIKCLIVCHTVTLTHTHVVHEYMISCTKYKYSTYNNNYIYRKHERVVKKMESGSICVFNFEFKCIQFKIPV